jgi:TrmH family RNA methyltransferase
MVRNDGAGANTLITSRANPALKRIRALRQRKERERSGHFFAEGIRLVGEAVQLGAPVEQLIAAPKLLERHPFARDLVTSQRAAGTPCLLVSDDAFASIATKEHPQGLGAVIRQHWMPLAEADANAGLCWIALADVQDPGNLGTILRTADAVGGAGVILLGHATDPYDPTAVRASMGALFTQRLVRAAWDEFTAWTAASGCHVIGTSDRAAGDYTSLSYPGPTVLLMGSEREGLSAEQQAAVDQMARIPMVGRADSLNLAVATAIMVYELFTQAHGRPPAAATPPMPRRWAPTREGTST